MTNTGPKWQHTTSNGKYFVSTSNIMFTGWETMVFTVKADGEIDYRDLDCERYAGEDSAYAGHIAMFQKWEGKD